MNYKVLFFVALAGIAAVGTFAIVQTSGLRADLADAVEEREAAEAASDDARDEIGDLEADVRRVRRELGATRQSLQEATDDITLEEALANGTVQRVPGLSADVSNFDCIDRSCSSVQGTATFVNDTQEGSAVTCLFRVEFEDGSTSHFSWFAEHVPPKGESVTDLYFTSNNPTPVDFWYDSDECYRGIATFSPGGGDI